MEESEKLEQLKKVSAELVNRCKVLLNQVDYTEGNCRLNEMVGAVLPVEVIRNLRSTITKAENLIFPV